MLSNVISALLLLLLARQFSPLYPRDELAFSENFPFVDGTVWVVWICKIFRYDLF